MKITKRQLKRIIKESLSEIRRLGFDSEGYEMTAQAATDARTYDAIQQVLSKSPGIEGAELVNAVIGLQPDLDIDDVFDFLDELQGDGEIAFDVENDAWRLST